MLRNVSVSNNDAQELPLWPAAERNKQPIAEVLRRVLPENGTLLEIASGTGQHAVYFAEALAPWRIQPTDYDAEHLVTLQRRVELKAQPSLLQPVLLDVSVSPSDSAALPEAPSAIYCANMLHIAPWSACIGLFRWAGALLGATQVLVTYGPYFLGDGKDAPSNVEFNSSLHARNPEWGVRKLSELQAVARDFGLELSECVAMPANNHCLVWQRA
jgi:hypothetical protein